MPVLRTIIRRYLVITLLLACNTFCLVAQSPVTREYQLKAVFLFNFTQFVEWPASSFRADQSPMVIGVLGKSPFGSFLEEIVAGEKVNGHPVIVQYYSNTEEIKTCHILFISEVKRRQEFLTNLKVREILTVSDAPDFLKQGGMIRFFTRDNKIQLQINPEASKAANLTISSKLLSLAEIFVSK